MLKGKTVAVIVSAYNEEKQIKNVLNSIPKFVDKIVVVNDGSTDKTPKIVKKYIAETKKSDLVYKNKSAQKKLTPTWVENKNPKNDRVILLTHKENSGKGSAVATGYMWCLENKIDCTATMDGDGQMDPKELEALCLPIVEEGIDYTKANRLTHRSAYFVIPKIRYFGNSVLSLFTKIASGYWRVSDTQTGYTAISYDALEAIKVWNLFTYYGYPNHMLVKLNMAYCTIKEIPMKPIYDVGEQSKMNIYKVVPKVSLLLLKLFFRRLYVKYLFKDFHPLFILYNFGIASIIATIPFFVLILKSFPIGASLPWQYFAIYAFFFISSLQSLSFAMWMDMMDNERLYIS